MKFNIVCFYIVCFFERRYFLDIGKKVKDLRIRLGLTQKELGDRAELSKGFISLVERNLTSPSISTLKEIIECLGTDLKEFFADIHVNKIVYKRADMCVKTDEDQKTQIVWLLPSAQTCELEPILLTIDPGGSTRRDKPHEGDEFGYVLSGRVTLHLGEKQFVVRKGESFHYTPMQTHYLENTSGKTAKIIWVAAPPTF